MRLFNDMVSAILACDKPVICRVNGMRIGGGQEIGMACDFSVAQDLARFGQAGPKHGSAPIGGATDFLPVIVGAERAMAACVLCEPFSRAQGVLAWAAHRHRARRSRSTASSSPTRWSRRSAMTRRVRPLRLRRAEDRRRARRKARRCSRAAASTSRRSTRRSRSSARKLLLTFPDCTTKTLEELRKPKLDALEPQQGELARVARAQHDDRGARRLPRLQRGHEGATARSTSSRCARRSPRGESWVGPLHDAIQPRNKRKALTP